MPIPWTRYAIKSQAYVPVNTQPPSELPYTWPEIFEVCDGLSMNYPCEVYTLAEDWQGHAAGRFVVLIEDYAWVEPDQMTGLALRPKGPGATVPAGFTASSVDCQMCALCQGRTQIVEGYGPVPAPLMIVGEAPGREEDLGGVPFIGASGNFLKAILGELGLSSRDYYATNAVRCRPDQNRDPTMEELQACRGWLKDEIDKVQPKAVLALGLIAWKTLSLVYQGLPEADGPRLFKAFHPAYLLRSPARRAEWKDQLAEAIAYAKGQEYVAPIVKAAPTWVEGPPDLEARYLAVDTETDSLEGEEDYAQTVVTVQLSGGSQVQLYRPVHHLALPAGQARLRSLTLERQVAPGASPGLQDSLGPLPGPDSLAPLPQQLLRELAPSGGREPGQEPGAFAWAEGPDILHDFHGRKHWYANVRFDGPRVGLDLRQLDIWEDIQLIAYVLRYERVGLDYLGEKLTGLAKHSRSAVFGTGKSQRTFSQALQEIPEQARDYALVDAVITELAAPVLWGQLRERPVSMAYYRNFEKPVVAVVHDLERAGAHIDSDALVLLREKFYVAQGSHETAVKALLGDINVASPQQIAKALQERGVPLRDKTKTGQFQVDEKALLRLAGVETPAQLADTDPLHSCVSHILSFREYKKLLSTYVEPLLNLQDAQGRVYTHFNQMVCDTNRFSSSKPINLQNIPARGEWGKPMRRVFNAKPGHVIVKADFSQLELRILAHYTREPALLEAYCSTPERDVHNSFAVRWGVDRSTAKNGVFAMAYQAEAETLAATIGLPKGDIGPFLRRMRTEMPALFGGWKDLIRRTLDSQGYTETLYGWRNYYPLYMSPVAKEARKALREAANMPIQGTAGGILKKLLLWWDGQANLWDSVRLILMVHDEVVFEVPYQSAGSFADRLERAATEINDLDVPLKLEVGIGPNWGDLRPWQEWSVT